MGEICSTNSNILNLEGNFSRGNNADLLKGENNKTFPIEKKNVNFLFIYVLFY